MPRSSAAIIGRPNVGKSTMFNRIVGRRISIEDPTSGVTRDRVLHPVVVGDNTFDLIDTGGIGIVDKQELSESVEQQIEFAIHEADVLIFLLDCRDGITPLDEEIALKVRKLNKPLVLAANKADTDKIEQEIHAFYELGFGEVIPVSAKQGRGIDDLLEKVCELLPENGDEIEEQNNDELKIAFAGKRNAGKSSIINKLAGSERVIVSNRPGTTRDSVDVRFQSGDEAFLAIDTAGLRKRGKMDDAIEFFSQVRSERSIRRADVVVLMIDASVPVSKVDKRIGDLIIEENKPCVIAINKWDLAVESNPDITPDAYHDYLVDELPGLYFAPIVVTSALTGENVWGVIEVARELQVQACREVSTGQVNNAIQDAYRRQHPAVQKGKMCKIYYGTQTGICPPSFVIFCNRPELLENRYVRYLSGQLRSSLGFDEVPLKISFRSSHDRQHERQVK